MQADRCRACRETCRQRLIRRSRALIYSSMHAEPKGMLTRCAITPACSHAVIPRPVAPHEPAQARPEHGMSKESYLDAVFRGISEYYSTSRRNQGAATGAGPACGLSCRMHLLWPTASHACLEALPPAVQILALPACRRRRPPDSILCTPWLPDQHATWLLCASVPPLYYCPHPRQPVKSSCWLTDERQFQPFICCPLSC